MKEQDKEILAKLNANRALPDVTEALADAPEPKEKINTENCIEIEGKYVEIKPTLLKYFANNAVSFYHILDTVPLPQIYMMSEEKNQIDGEVAILTFVSAVLDDPVLAKRIYRKMDAGQLLQMLKIFKRLNGIEEREEATKKAAAVKAQKA